MPEFCCVRPIKESEWSVVTLQRGGHSDAKQVKRAVYVTVYRELTAYPGLLLEWRRDRDRNGYYNWSAKVIYLDGDRLLHQGWFPPARVKPAPYAEPDERY
jgi:hypothetical protein